MRSNKWYIEFVRFDLNDAYLHFQTISMYSASCRAFVTLRNKVVHRNRRTYLQLQAVETKVEVGNLITELRSSTLSPSMTNSINKKINANWRDLLPKVEPKIEAYSDGIMKSIMSPILDTTAIEDFCLKRWIIGTLCHSKKRILQYSMKTFDFTIIIIISKIYVLWLETFYWFSFSFT